MGNITLSIPEQIHESMRHFSEVKWSEVARKAIVERVETLKLAERLAKKSKLTQQDVEEFNKKLSLERQKGFCHEHVLDSNVLFSALVKESITRKIILEYNGHFLFPSYIFEEFQKHRSVIISKSQLSEKEFSELFQLLLSKVVIVPTENLLAHRNEALTIARNIDPDDALFFACALAHKPSVIWSNDKKLKNQSKVQILNTLEIIDYLNS